MTGEYLRGWHAGVEAAKRVVEAYIQRGRRTPIRARQEAAPAILGQLEALAEPMDEQGDCAPGAVAAKGAGG